MHESCCLEGPGGFRYKMELGGIMNYIILGQFIIPVFWLIVTAAMVSCIDQETDLWTKYERHLSTIIHPITDRQLIQTWIDIPSTDGFENDLFRSFVVKSLSLIYHNIHHKPREIIYSNPSKSWLSADGLQIIIWDKILIWGKMGKLNNVFDDQRLINKFSKHICSTGW